MQAFFAFCHQSLMYYVKSVQTRYFFWSTFSSIRTEHQDVLRKFPYSVRIQKNTDQKKLRIWTLSCSDDAVNSQREEKQHSMISGRFFSIFKILKRLEI